MSPRPSRTVTGVFTKVTRTFTLACVSLGGNCTSTPDFGAIGPEGDCPQAETPGSANRNGRVINVAAICGIFDHLTTPAEALRLRPMANPCHGSVLDSTHVQQKTLPRAAAIPTIKVRVNGRKGRCPTERN